MREPASGDERSTTAPAARLSRARGALWSPSTSGHTAGHPIARTVEAFEVSGDTVRRDLDRLDEQGLLARTHGGAVALEKPAADLGSITERGSRQLAAKRAIGVAAARQVRDGETVLINGGSTTVAVARAMEAGATSRW